jgi:hypothetical protein
MKYIKSLELEENYLYSYFNYIYESVINGHFKQVEDLIKKLNKPQKEEFLYFINSEVSEEYKNELIKRLI